MTQLWVQLPHRPAPEVDLAGELGSWQVYHDACGMSAVEVDVRADAAAFECTGCPWAEAVPTGRDDPGPHNVAALRRLAVSGQAQTLQLQTAMGGLLGLGVALLAGNALRVDIAPLG